MAFEITAMTCVTLAIVGTAYLTLWCAEKITDFLHAFWSLKTDRSHRATENLPQRSKDGDNTAERSLTR